MGGDHKLKAEDFLVLEESRNYKDYTDALESYIKKIETHFPQKPKVDDEGNEEAVEVGPVGHVPDLLADAKVIEWAGLGFGEYETYRLQKSLKKLSTDSGAKNVRFFGKIYGTEKDK